MIVYDMNIIHVILTFVVFVVCYVTLRYKSRHEDMSQYTYDYVKTLTNQEVYLLSLGKNTHDVAQRVLDERRNKK